MNYSAVTETMLYCPKCQHTYETGSQRFCNNDGSRLLIASAGKSANQPGGVFSSLLGRSLPNIANSERDEKLSPTPRYVPFEKPAMPDFLNRELELDDDDETPAKPVARLIRPSEIHSGTAEVGDRKANPTGRLALTWEQPKILFRTKSASRFLPKTRSFPIKKFLFAFLWMKTRATLSRIRSLPKNAFRSRT